MTVSNETSAVTLPGNGSNKDFSYNFLIPYQSDGVTPAVKVFTVSADGTTVERTIDTDFTITGVGNTAGGSVHYPVSGSALASGASLMILRALAYTQPYSFRSTKLNGAQVMAALDNIVLELQQLKTQLANITVTLDIQPNPFEFTSLTDQPLGTPVESEVVSLDGWAAMEPLPVYVTGAGFEFRTADGVWGTATQYVLPPNSLQLRYTTGAENLFTATATAWCGVESATWSVTTLPAAAPGTTVGSTAALNAALAAATGGETILVLPGTYTGVTVATGKTYTTPVTVTASDPANKPVIRNFTLTNVSKLTFDTVDLQVWGTTGTAFWIIDSDNIIFDTCHVYGQTLDNDPSNDTGSGFTVWGSDHCTWTGCLFEEILNGLIVGKDSHHITVTQNQFRRMREDGFKAAQVTFITITDNWFHDFRPSAGHPDNVQFFTQGATSANTDITISGNLLQRDGGGYTQGFFIAEENGSLPYERVVVDDNMLVSVATNSLRTNNNDGFVLTDTVFVTVIGDAAPCYPLIQNCDGVTVTGCSYKLIGGLTTCTNVTETGNTITASVSQANADAQVAAWRATHPNVPS